MGNQPSRPAITALDSYVEELGSEVVYDKSIGTSRFLKTIKAKHTNGPLLIKIFFKPLAPQGLSLAAHRRRLKAERDALLDVPNVHPYQSIFESEKAAYLVRQYLASDLYDRISTRPFLSGIEKKWFTYQILVGMREIRSRKISHGNLKPSNVLVTTSNWIYITDLSPFKPVYIPEDNPADFDFFFDDTTSGRRSCYIAPERFFAAGSKAERRRAESDWQDGQRDGKVTEAMEVFSAGCTIAELWLDGKDVFNLSGMLAWREGKSSPEGVIGEITDPLIQSMVRSMLSLDPASRPSFDNLLATNRSTTFPEFFYTFFHQYNLTLNEIQTPSQLLRPHVGPEVDELGAAGGESARDSFGEADWRIERVRKDLDSIKSYLDVDSADEKAGESESEIEDGPALLVLALVTSNVRACFRSSSKVHALEVITELSSYLTDETKLDRLVPFVVALLRDEAPGVRSASIRALTTLLDTVESVTLSNAAIVTEYILPNAWHLARDEDVSVRTAYATAVASLADVGSRFLEISESLRTQGLHLAQTDDLISSSNETTYEECQEELHRIIQSEVTSLLYDASSSVKRAVLVNITSFCVFFGRVKTNEILLSHMFTYLNDSDWELRYSFFESIVGVAAFVGSTSLEAFIFPLMTQAVYDVEESVVARVLASLRSLSELDLFSKPRLWDLLSLSLGLISHPNVWIRQAAAGVIASTSRRLSRSDAWCLLYPNLSPLLRSAVGSLSEEALLGAILPPLPRAIYDSALLWAKKSSRSPFWLSSDGNDGRLFPDLPAHLSSNSEDDQAQIAALRQKGLLPDEDKKLLVLRSHISRVASASSSLRGLDESDPSQGPPKPDLQVLSLIRLSVTPQTVFINPRPSPAAGTGRRIRRKVSTRSTADDLSSLRGPPSSSRPQPLRLTSKLSSHIPSAPPSVVSASPLPTAIQIPRSSRQGTPDAAFSPSSESIFSMDSSFAQLGSRATRPFSTATGGGGPDPKSAASVGAVRANAFATLESSSVIRGDDSESEHQGARSSTPIGRGSPSTGATYLDSRATNSAFPSVTGYDGSDPGIKSLIEAVYLETFRDPLPELGPRVSSRRGSAAARIGSVPRPSSSSSSTPAEPVLVCQLSEHVGPILGILVSPDNTFFVSAAQDGLVKVWDTARLERNTTSKPRLVHTLGTRPTAMCLIEASHCFAIAGEDGSVVVLRVHLQAGSSSLKFREVEVVRYFQLESSQSGDFVTRMSHTKSEVSNELVLVTQQSSILSLDLHGMHITKKMTIPLHLGSPTTLCCDPRRLWIVVGTLEGWLTLWDMRFGLLLRTWRVAGQPIREVVVHPSRGGGRFIVVASGGESSTSDDVVLETWSIEASEVVEVYKSGSSSSFSTTSTATANPPSSPPSSSSPNRPSSSPSTPTVDQDPSLAVANLLAGFERRPPPPKRRDRPSSNTLAIVAVPRGGGGSSARSQLPEDIDEDQFSPRRAGSNAGAGALWIGGEDRFLRRIDLQNFSKSSILGAVPIEGVSFSSNSQNPTVNQEFQSLPLPETSTAHPDSIQALAVVSSPSSTYLVSGDRSGTMRIWRIQP
ncbi:hypothetical protein BDY24DRAFT_379669 [Mrakia frigida]|uniref:ubiquitin-binding serine/threonine protein kinase VPS15 n=1 Tax=Mrakia frigida TaxID=29902 RepID=UPI003FCBF7A6